MSDPFYRMLQENLIEDYRDPLDDVDFNDPTLWTEEDQWEMDNPEHGCETYEEYLQTQEAMKNVRKLVEKARSYWAYHNHCQEHGVVMQLDYHEWLSLENPAAVVGFVEGGESDEPDGRVGE